MRHFLLLAASVSVVALSGCSTVSDLWSGDENSDLTPPKRSAPAAAAAPIKASNTEEQEMTALMGEDKNKDSISDTYVEPHEVPPPPTMNDAGAPVAEQASAADKPQAGPAPAGAPTECPAVEILPDTKSITYFDGPEGTVSGDMIARAVLTDIRGGCEYSQNGVDVDIDMIMQGKITKKGRYQGRSDLEAFMTFPYFIAVMSPEGKMVDKKILATAMRFKPNVDDLDHSEKITQSIPLGDISQGGKYVITLGFQLNRKQLEFNRGGVSDTVEKMEGRATKPDEGSAAAKKKPSKAAANLDTGKSGGSKMQPVTE